MKHILVIGAGRSSSSLIAYLLQHAAAENWQIRVGDMNGAAAVQKVIGFERGTGFGFDINNAEQREAEIAAADLVVSMLPAFMHGAVARDCVRLGKHLVTASYVSDEMRALHNEAVKNGIVLLNEIGLDPGIDHISAMQIIDRIRHEGGTLHAFYSYCGGLVAPESNDNPWGYKFSWNPRNVILAGQGTAQYIENGNYKYLPYSRLFGNATSIEVEGHGRFDAYANRDSLSYRSVYGIDEIPTLLRGTLRMPGYCKAWNVFVQLGITDDGWKIHNASELTYAQFIEAFLPPGSGSLRERVAAFMHTTPQSEEIEMVAWTGILGNEKIPLHEASPAQILQQLLEQKWLLRPGDKDMIVMQHIFEYTLHGQTRKLKSSLVVKGDDEIHTAMAKTVGLPAAMAVRRILRGEFTRTGVCVPVTPDIYEPLLKELEAHGICFEEKE
ncbi:MAG: saccharopine dehydrogenase NADP-binding domain-containing protein [Bacteroidia bacterium]|jgi:saccharopine dehydrogenase-like NADP-dependent oxidoreductase|nr:saccharopine dehydrogenase NADP-binding domain-containing protein [Bacteroidia bacterium]